MALLSALLWLSFATYVGLFLCVPLALLWEIPGLIVGILATSIFLIFLRYRGIEKIAGQLGVRRLSPAEAPYLKAMVEEYCRRLNLGPPKIGVMSTPAINVAIFGFTQADAYLAITQGALDNLTRPQLSALVSRQLCHLRAGGVAGETWLCRFLGVFENGPKKFKSKHDPNSGYGAYAMGFFLKRAILFPLTLFPAFVLKDGSSPSDLDLKSLRVSRAPQALSEGLRRIEAMAERLPFFLPLSTRHLFLLPPISPESLGRVFLGREDLAKRIDAIEKLAQVVALT